VCSVERATLDFGCAVRTPSEPFSRE
jgi:hypothetical protein